MQEPEGKIMREEYPARIKAILFVLSAINHMNNIVDCNTCLCNVCCQHYLHTIVLELVLISSEKFKYTFSDKQNMQTAPKHNIHSYDPEAIRCPLIH